MLKCGWLTRDGNPVWLGNGAVEIEWAALFIMTLIITRGICYERMGKKVHGRCNGHNVMSCGSEIVWTGTQLWSVKWIRPQFFYSLVYGFLHSKVRVGGGNTNKNIIVEFCCLLIISLKMRYIRREKLPKFWRSQANISSSVTQKTRDLVRISDEKTWKSIHFLF